MSKGRLSFIECLVTASKAASMQEINKTIERLAQSRSTVLILGNPSTGKEALARAIHQSGPRANNQFIRFNATSSSGDLFETELFGQQNDTLYIHDLDKLSLVLQKRVFELLTSKTKVRVIASTQNDLRALTEQGFFLKELFEQLSSFQINMPNLAERREDISQLTSFFLQRAAADMGVAQRILSKEAEAFLCSYPWPDNLRQLDNTCRWLTAMPPSREVRLSDLPTELLNQKLQEKENNCDWQTALRTWAQQALQSGAKGLLTEAAPTFERILLEAALQQADGRKRDAAELLGWGRNTLTRKLKELGLQADATESDE